jgi:methylated-DNA-[protein]-cysteine S-methyltransferase
VSLHRTTVVSPLGPLTIEASDRGLRTIRFDPDRWPAVEPAESAAEDVRLVDDPLLEATARELAEYFDGRRTFFDLPLDLRTTAFRRTVLEAMAAIPYGQVWSYRELGRHIGRDAGAARAIGQACHDNPLPIVLPCHRVVASDGSLGGYAAGLDVKRWLLGLERGDPAVPPGGWEPASAARVPTEAPTLFD